MSNTTIDGLSDLMLYTSEGSRRASRKMLFPFPIGTISASSLPGMIYFRVQNFSKGGTDAIKGVFHLK
jgi:hypothetical protein